MRPVVRFLSNGLIERIISEGRDIMCKLGIEIHNEGIISLLADHGARIEKRVNRVYFTKNIIDKAIIQAPQLRKSYSRFDYFLRQYVV